MSQHQETGPLRPVFEQPDGVALLGDERTVRFDNPGPPVDHWAGASPYLMGDAYWDPAVEPSHRGGIDLEPQQYRTVVQPPVQPAAWAGGPYYSAPEHPQATTVLVLGVVSFAMPILSFIAWYMGGRAKAEIARGAPYPYAGNLRVGHVIGKVVGILTIIGGGILLAIFALYALAMVSLFAWLGAI